MTARCALLLLSLAACTEDLTHQPVIPPAGGKGGHPRTRTVPVTWRSELCQLGLPDAGGVPGVSFSGECTWKQVEPVACNWRDDDFYILAERALPGGRELRFYVNVERYHGPGEYPNLAQAQVTVRDGPTLYRWMDETASISLAGEGAGDKARVTSVRLTKAHLAAEPGTPTSGFIDAEGGLPCAPAPQPIEQP